MANIDHNYLIEGHFEGTLNESEKALFREKMDNDQEFAQEVKDLKLLEKGLTGLGVNQFTEEVAQWEKNFQEKNQPKEAKVVGFKLSRYYTAIAAAVVLLVGLTFLIPYLNQNNGSDLESIYAEYYQPYEDMIITRGDSVPEGEKLLQEAMEAYSGKDYQKAISILKQYVADSVNDVRPYLYIGISQMELGQYDEARSSFDKAKGNDSYRQQAEWYELLLLLKSKNKPEAIAFANEVLASNPDHYRAEEMGKMLGVLQ